MNNNNNSNRGNNNRRRGRGNRPQGGGNQNRIDSRARGNAPQMLDKYRKLAQDAQHNGEKGSADSASDDKKPDSSSAKPSDEKNPALTAG